MFTGIVQAVGRIVAVEPGPSARRLVVDGGALEVADVAIGDSIAVSGCCLTVVSVERGGGTARLDRHDAPDRLHDSGEHQPSSVGSCWSPDSTRATMRRSPPMRSTLVNASRVRSSRRPRASRRWNRPRAGSPIRAGAT